MSEICLDCYNEIMKANDTKRKFIITRKPDLCEECRQFKPVIIRVKTRYILKEWCEEIAENIRYYRNASK